MLSDEQKKIRKQGVGGSEIAAVAGLNPWSSAVDVWQRKVGLVDESEGDYNTERGTFLEDCIARWMEYRQDYEVRKCGTIVHPDYPYVVVTPDGSAHDDRTGERVAAIEIKSPHFRTAGDWEDPALVPDGIPHYYIPQLMWECAGLNIDRCDVGALIGGDLLIYTVRYNQKLFEVLREKAERFMEYVVKETPPPVDGSDSASKWLKKRFPEHIESHALLTSESDIEKHIFDLKAVRAKIDKLEAAKKLAENTIKERIGQAPGIQGPWGKITWKKTKNREDYDTKNLVAYLERDHPELLKGFHRTRPGPRMFKPYWKKGL